MASLIPDSYLPFVKKAFDDWAPAAAVHPLKSLNGGRSGASVLLVDVKFSVDTKSVFPPGQYILKLDHLLPDSTTSESERHAWITGKAPEFARCHMPKLEASYKHETEIALLYGIAGSNLALITTAEHLKSYELENRLVQVMLALGKDLNKNYEIDQGVTASHSLKDWLGYRLSPVTAPRLHEFIVRETGDAPVFTYSTYVLINPLWLCNWEQITNDKSLVRFLGASHGDLNCRNILLDRQPFRTDFWIIDFALANEGPLFFDQAYLELDILLDHLSGADPERMLSVLVSLDTDLADPHSRNINIIDDGIVACFRKVRQASRDAWIQREGSRQTSLHAQVALARIAVSLNFVNKAGMDDTSRRLALAYGAYFSRVYLESYYRESFQILLAGARAQAYSVKVVNRTTTISTQADSAQWMDAFARLGRFDDTMFKYVLILPPLPNPSQNFGTLGLLPWSLVIDTDPESDSSGAYQLVEPILSSSRTLVKFGCTPIEASFANGTAWAMINGWPSHSEPVPAGLREWRQTYLPVLTAITRELKQHNASLETKVLIVASGPVDTEKLSRVVERIDEELGKSAEFIVIGEKTIADAVGLGSYIKLSTEEFIDGLIALRGRRESVDEPELPAKEGTAKLSLADLRNIEEDCSVLHGAILQTSAKETEGADDFWRGSRPTWFDLHAGVDIRRSNSAELLERLRHGLNRALVLGENNYVSLYHTPGAGGTTAALRAAWDLRSEYPTLVLRKISTLTVDRLESLYKICQKPLLIVADSSIMNDQERADLLNALYRSHCRAVILHTIRSSHPDKAEKLNLVDPLDSQEASRFLKEFSSRTTEPKRRRQLEQITNSDDSIWTRYRSPFFYGLITYERGYKRLDKYVATHLAGISYSVKKLITYISLVTRYCQLGIPQSLLLRLKEKDANEDFNPEKEFGEDIARLVISQNGILRLIHPLVAEEVLNQLIGNGDNATWKDALVEFSIYFLKDASAHSTTDDRDLKDVLSEVFISRETWWADPANESADPFVKKLQFSELIETIPSKSDQRRVLIALKDAFPKDAHYWNHLGRHYIYKKPEDFEEAEKCLLVATKLAPEDPLHYHTLGLVRRFWVEDIKAKFLSSAERRDSLKLLRLVVEKVEAAAENFAKGRELDETNGHPYITHMQMLLTVIEGLLSACGVDRISRLKDIPEPVAIWLKEQLAVVEALLEKRSRLAASTGSSSFVNQCVDRLKTVYGDFQAVIKMWESELAKGGEGISARRALATVYVAQNERLWGRVPASQLRKIVEMMRENIKSDPGNERDLRMWFQAYRRLPEFSFLDAMGRLETWATRSGAADAYYYLYILHFLRWKQGLESSESATLDFLRLCRNKAIGRQTFIYEWFGKGPEWCPLVSEVERKLENGSTEYDKPCRLLERVQGTIEQIEGGYAGTIKVGQHLRAFFAPRDKFRASKNINDIVNFYLGFRHDGLRAWAVEPGPATNDGGT